MEAAPVLEGARIRCADGGVRGGSRGRLITGGEDGWICIWSADSGHIITCWKAYRQRANIAASPDGRWIASGGMDGVVRLWDVTNVESTTVTFLVRWLLVGYEPREPAMEFRGHTQMVNAVAFDPSGRWLASASGDHTIRLWSLDDRKELACLLGHEDAVNAIAFDRTGEHLASASSDGTVKLWYVLGVGQSLSAYGRANGRQERQVTSLTFSDDSALIAMGCGDGTTRLWDVTGISGDRFVCALPLASGPGCTEVKGLAFTNNNAAQLLVVRGPNEKTVERWDRIGSDWRRQPQEPALRQEIFRRDAGQSVPKVTAFAASPVVDHDDPVRRSMVVAGSNGFFQARDIYTCALIDEPTTAAFAGQINCAAYSPDGRWVAAGWDDGSIGVWDSATWQLRCLVKGKPPAAAIGPGPAEHTGAVNSIAWADDPENGDRWLLISASSDKTVRAWGVPRTAVGRATGTDAPSELKLRYEPISHAHPAKAVAVSLRDARIAIGWDDNTVWIVDAATGERLLTLRGHTSEITSLAFSPDGTVLASGDHFGEVRLWIARRCNSSAP